MNQRLKLVAKIRNNPRGVRFQDALKVARWLGFVHVGGSGSHRAYSRTGESTLLNFQKSRAGKIPEYQAQQLIVMVDKYEDEL